MQFVGAWAVALVALFGLWVGEAPAAPAPAPLKLERTIVLAGVAGRIDHMALDAKGQRLFVAKLGAGSVEELDLQSGKSLGRITGLEEP